MKKRLLVIMILLITSVLISAVTWVAVVSVRNASSSEIHHKIENPIIPQPNESNGDSFYADYLKERLLPSNKSLKTVLYPECEILEDLSPSNNFLNWLSQYTFSSDLLAYYPTDNVRRIETAYGDHYYVVYMTESGGRLFMFMDEDGKLWGHPVYMKKLLRHNDFSSCHPGDPMTKVISVDPAATAYMASFPPLYSHESAEDGNRRIEEFYGLESYFLTSVHLLEDGFLEIRYEYAEDGAYRIKNLHYAEDFRGVFPGLELAKANPPQRDAFPDEDGYNEAMQSYLDYLPELEKRAFSYDFRILPKDYIGEEIVIADVSPVQKVPVLAKDKNWSLTVEISEESRTESFTLSKSDFLNDEITTVMTSRFVGGDARRGIETVFAGGITLDHLAEKMKKEDYSSRQRLTACRGGNL